MQRERFLNRGFTAAAFSWTIPALPLPGGAHSPPLPMLTLSLAKGHRQWLRLLRLIQPLGFCHACQRPTAWLDLGPAFRCRQCGGDPLYDA